MWKQKSRNRRRGRVDGGQGEEQFTSLVPLHKFRKPIIIYDRRETLRGGDEKKPYN